MSTPPRLEKPAPAAFGKTSIRLALSKREAADSLGCSLRFFEQHILPELPVARRRSKRFIPVSAIERWLDENARQTVERAA